MFMIEDESTKSKSSLAFMVKSEDKEDDEIIFFDVQNNLRNYSKKELRLLSSVLIDVFQNHVIEMESLAKKLNKIEIEKVSLF